MGKQNLAVNQMLERKDIFADLMNGTVFKGQQILKPEHLELISGQSGVFYEQDNGSKKALERRGDIRMRADLGTYSVVLANETQNKVHYAMPVRSLLYDALEYTKQVQEIEKRHIKEGQKLQGDAFLSGITKEDRLNPVITTILYFGSEEDWDGCKSIYEMLDIDTENSSAGCLREYLPDYKINLIYGGNIENPEIFQTCLQHIFSMLKYNKNKQQLYQYVKDHENEINQMDHVEMTAAFILLGEQKRLAKLLEAKNNSEEEITMCKAIDDLIRDGEIRGKAIGKAQGEAIGRAQGEAIGTIKGLDKANKLNQLLVSHNRINDIIEACHNPTYQEQLFAEFNL